MPVLTQDIRNISQSGANTNTTVPTQDIRNLQQPDVNNNFPSVDPSNEELLDYGLDTNPPNDNQDMVDID